MRDFHIWGRINHIGPSQFFVIVSAVHGGPVQHEPNVRTGQATSLHDAEAVKRALMIELGQAVHDRGDRVVDVEGE